jgi:hypothetical protein
MENGSIDHISVHVINDVIYRWECSKEGAQLLLNCGIEYDHSMSHEDHCAYWLRTGDEWTKIDYSKKAESWMKPLIKGKDTGLVEIPASWHIDDLPPLMFMKAVPNSVRAFPF